MNSYLHQLIILPYSLKNNFKIPQGEFVNQGDIPDFRNGDEPMGIHLPFWG